MECKLCGNAANNTPYVGREMALGTRERFEYFQCSNCECLQIQTMPADMSQYYKDSYYSFAEFEQTKSRNLLKRLRDKLVTMRDMYAITDKGLIGKLLYTLHPFTELRGLSHYPITKNTSILDVGCGRGHYLHKLKTYGFQNLLGIDPFLDSTLAYNNGLVIQKKNLSEASGTWDIIMLHHSLEHMPNQHEALKKISSLLKDDGMCLIRIPTVSSDPWEEYTEHWVCFEPPRHFFLHSHKSLRMIAEQAGMVVESITSESNPYSFYGSEYYRRDIPAAEWVEDEFSPAERKVFAQRAKEINKRGRGDMISVILRKK